MLTFLVNRQLPLALDWTGTFLTLQKSVPASTQLLPFFLYCYKYHPVFSGFPETANFTCTGIDLFKNFYWSVHFCFAAEQLSYTFVSTVLFIFSSILVFRRNLVLVPCAVQQDLVGFRTVCNSLHLPVPHAHAPSPLPSPWQPHACSLWPGVSFCFVDRFVRVVF